MLYNIIYSLPHPLSLFEGNCMELRDTPTKNLTDVFLNGLGTRTYKRKNSSLVSGQASGEPTSASATATASTKATSAPSPASGGSAPAATPPGSTSLGRGKKRSLTDVFLDGLDGVDSSVEPSISKLSPHSLTSRSLLTKVKAKNDSAVFKANSGVGLDEGLLRQAVLRHNTPLYERLRERGEHEVFKNVYNTVMPKPYKLLDQPVRPEPPADHHAKRALLSHDDLVRRCAEGYRAPPGAPPALVKMIDDAVVQAGLGLAKSSGSKYARAWNKWEKWVSENTQGMAGQGASLSAFDAASKHELVAAYLTDLVTNSGSISSAQSTLSSLQYYIGLSNMPFHFKSFIEAVMKGLKRQYGKVAEKNDNFTTGQVVDMLYYLLGIDDNPSELASLRLAVLIIVCYFGSARHEEAIDLRFNDITVNPSGNLVLDFCKGKTNQFKKRHQTVISDGFIQGTDFNPVGIVKEYLQRLRLTPGGAPIMLFPQLASRAVHPGQPKVLVVKGDGSEAIKYDYCRQQLKSILTQPDFRDKHGLDGKFGWHSFRGGSLTAQAGQGVPLHLMQQQARHANPTTTLSYVNSIESEKAKASAALLADIDPLFPPSLPRQSVIKVVEGRGRVPPPPPNPNPGLGVEEEQEEIDESDNKTSAPSQEEEGSIGIDNGGYDDSRQLSQEVQFHSQEVHFNFGQVEKDIIHHYDNTDDDDEAFDGNYDKNTWNTW